MSFFMPAIAFTFITTELELDRLRLRASIAKNMKKSEEEVDSISKQEFSPTLRLIDWYIDQKFSIICE